MTKPTTNVHLSLDNPKTRSQLERIATSLLRKTGFKSKRPVKDGVIPAECCGVRGLKPTWHGRAS